MKRFYNSVYMLRFVLLFGLTLVMFPKSAQSQVSLKEWYFPKPFTMDSPMVPQIFGGMDFSMSFSDAGVGIGFPIHVILSTEEKNFVIEGALPFAIGIPDNDDTNFYAGNIKVGLRGKWRFLFPFFYGEKIPAAWSIGLDLSLPIASIWGENSGFSLVYPMYTHDIVSWVPECFSFYPKVQFAVGKPIFFMEMQFGLANVIPWDKGYQFLPTWGITLGTQPHKVVSVTLEFGGVHEATDNDFFLAHKSITDKSSIWGGVGLRFYLQTITLGVLARVPFTTPWHIDEGRGLDPNFSFTLFVGGFEQ